MSKPEPNEIPVTTRRLRELPPDVAPAANVRYDGIWNRPDRPRIVGIIGWVTAAVGYLSFVLKLAGLPVLFFPSIGKTFNPDFIDPHLTRGQFLGSVLLLIAEALVGLVAIAGGLGSLKLREWGRRVILAYGIAALLLSALRAAFQYATFDSTLDSLMAASTQPVDRQVAENGLFFFYVTSTLMFAVWPLLVLAIMTRRHVKDAFNRAAGPLAPVPGGEG